RGGDPPRIALRRGDRPPNAPPRRDPRRIAGRSRDPSPPAGRGTDPRRTHPGPRPGPPGPGPPRGGRGRRRTGMTVRFGFSLQGRGRLADRDAITTLARRADRLGFESIWVTDRLLIPTADTRAYPYSATGAFPLGPDEPWLEALTAVTYLTAVTERIHVGTSVLVIPYRNPVHVAKALATADYL